MGADDQVLVWGDRIHTQRIRHDRLCNAADDQFLPANAIVVDVKFPSFLPKDSLIHQAKFISHGLRQTPLVIIRFIWRHRDELSRQMLNVVREAEVSPELELIFRIRWYATSCRNF
jgi:hypothetical protein